MQDISGNHLRDISSLNALPHLLSLKADHNQLTSAQLQEVGPPHFLPYILDRNLDHLFHPFQLQYLQVASFAHNTITSTEGIAHPMLENLNLACEFIWSCTVCTIPSALCAVRYLFSKQPPTCSQPHHRGVWHDTTYPTQSTSA